MDSLGLKRRGTAVLALFALVLGWLVVTPATASASSGGTARGAGLDGDLLAVTIGGIPVLPGLSLDAAVAGTPPADGAGNGSQSASVVSLDLGSGLLTAAAVEGDTLRTTDSLSATAEVTDVSLNLFGVPVLGADVISSSVVCPITELGTVPTQADVDDILGLTIGGTLVGVGADVDLPVTIPGLLDASLRVRVTSPTSTTPTSASAVGLRVDIDVTATVPIVGTIVTADLVDLDLAATDCTRPDGSVPTTTSIVPAAGPELTPVTINGTGFIPDFTTVDFGGTTIPASAVTVDDTPATYGTSLSFSVPDDSPLGPTAVTVTTPVGTSTPALTFTVTPAQPVATSLVPDTGTDDTVVTVTGDNFIPGATSVDFGGTTIPAGSVTVASDGNSLTFDVPDGAPFGPTDVTVTTAGGTTTPPLTFTVVPDPPIATSLDPTSGPEDQLVTVFGANFVPDATTIEFGATTILTALIEVAPDGNSLTFVVPDDMPLGPTSVTVVTPGGFSAPPLSFEVTPAVPEATSLVPTSGPEGTLVLLQGDNLIPGATSVDFGGITIPAGSVTVASDGNALTFNVPDDAPLGATDVTVTTAGGTSSPPLTFTVTEGVPTATSLSPTSGPELTVVTVNGDNFVPGATSVDFGGTTIPAGSVTVAPGGDSLTFNVPDDAPLGATDVTVTTAGGTTTPPLTFTVTPAPPVIDALLPTSGPELTLVNATGDNLIPGATTVSFGGITIPAGSVAVASDGNSLTFAVPDDAPLGATDVTVTTAGGTSPPLTFTVTAAVPTTTSLSPTSGPELTVVTVDGDNFIPGGTSVEFGAATIPAGAVAVASDGNSLTFVVPDDSPLGPTDVVVVTAGGSSSPALSFEVTLAPPSASSLDPTSGPEGTVVTLDGDNFVVGATSVGFGSTTIPAGMVTVAPGGNSLTFMVPDDSPLGATDVTATTSAGTTAPLTFTVTAGVPTATSLSPTSGPELTVVTVDGDDFVPGATSVEFGSTTIPAEAVTVALDGNSLTFVVPDDSPLGATPVVVVTAGGSSTPALSFEVTPAAPTADSLTPPEGGVGTVVTVNGDNFIPGATSVDFGGTTIPAGSVTVASDGNSLTFAVPPAAVLGLNEVTVTTIGGTTAPLDFTVLPTPTATGLSPTSGPEGTVVTVVGSDFVPGGTSVEFGDITIPPGSVTVAPDGSSLTFVVPDDAPLGATPVVVVTAGGSTDPLTFTVTPGQPTIGGITPTEGPSGTTVVIEGDNFVPGGATVVIGGTQVSPADVSVSPDGNTLTFVVPGGLAIGPHDVFVVTDGGTSGPVTFTVTEAPPAAPTGSTGSLPYTGSGSTLPIVAVGLLLLLLGAALAFGGSALRHLTSVTTSLISGTARASTTTVVPDASTGPAPLPTRAGPVLGDPSRRVHPPGPGVG